MCKDGCRHSGCLFLLDTWIDNCFWHKSCVLSRHVRTSQLRTTAILSQLALRVPFGSEGLELQTGRLLRSSPRPFARAAVPMLHLSQDLQFADLLDNLLVEASRSARTRLPTRRGLRHNHRLEEQSPRLSLSVASDQRREDPGNDRCREVFQEAASFKAMRDLGIPEAGDLVNFGLDTPEDFLVVSTAPDEERFALGKVLYGTSRRYVRREANGKLYVVGTAFLKTMESEGVYI